MSLDEIELQANDLRFPALAAGRSGPLVLCLHGFPDHRGTFAALLPALAGAGYRAVAPTMRGYAPSAQPADGDYYLSSIVSDVLSFIDQLGDGTAYVVGHDWGAAVAYLAAAA